MNKTGLALITVMTLFGCTTVAKMDAFQSAVEHGKFNGLDQNSKFSIVVPSPHSGPFESVDQINFLIEEGTEHERYASAITGKSRETGEWEILLVKINENGKWVDLQSADPN